jgi:chemotaxis protein methyltransferase CheR
MALSGEFDIELPLLLEAIHLKYSYDFRRYATSSLKRRLVQALEHFDCRSLSALQERVLRESEVMHRLLAYLTVLPGIAREGHAVLAHLPLAQGLDPGLRHG